MHATTSPMRRAIIQNLRTFRRPTPRKALKSLRISASQNVSFQRSLASQRPPQPQQSMRFSRRVSVPAALGVAAAASYYAYQQIGAQSVIGPDASPANGVHSRGSATAAATAYSSVPHSPIGVHDAEVPEAVRKASVIGSISICVRDFNVPAGGPVTLVELVVCSTTQPMGLSTSTANLASP